MKVVAAIQVRMGSTRFPGKVMKDLRGKPVLGRIIERVKRARTVDEVIVATSLNPENDLIARYCSTHGVRCFRGSENDVLARVLGALQASEADVGIEVFGDCPLIDPGIIDQIVSFYLSHRDQYDFVSNDLKTTYPPGVEVEVYSVAILEDAARRTRDPVVREHGTLFIRQHPELYRLHNIEAPAELFFPDMEIELDTEEDFQVIDAIYRHCEQHAPDFDIYDIITFLKENPHIQDINRSVKRRWQQFRKDNGHEQAPV